MTVEAMSSLPFQAGGAVAAAAGRTALWVISLYMRQPLRNTAVVAFVGLSAMAGSNALYHQSHHHPAPLFGTFEDDPAPVVKKKAKPAVLPAERPRQLLEPVSAETTGSVDEPARTPEAIGNDDVQAMQQKLIALGMLDGKADGIFGPHTARAIKAFEASIGRHPRGLLTLDILNLIRAADLPAPPSAAVPAISLPAAPQKTETGSLPPIASPAAQVKPAALTPLPAPAPLLASATPGASPAMAGDAGDPDADATTVATIDDANGVETLPMSRQPGNVMKRSVPTIAVHAEQAQQMPGALTPAQGQDASTDPDIVAAVQRGLNSLGFLHAPVDGVAGEATAKAIRNFEVYFNYNVTGRVTRDLVQLLEQNGAQT
jgi:peptidoglycan hydrolase-like protein with peptidoglycan-binding domain